MRPTQKQNKVDGVSQIFFMLCSFSHHDTPMVVTITLLLFICFVLFKYIPYSVQCTVYTVQYTLVVACLLRHLLTGRWTMSRWTAATPTPRSTTVGHFLFKFQVNFFKRFVMASSLLSSFIVAEDVWRAIPRTLDLLDVWTKVTKVLGTFDR